MLAAGVYIHAPHITKLVEATPTQVTVIVAETASARVTRPVIVTLENELVAVTAVVPDAVTMGALSPTAAAGLSFTPPAVDFSSMAPAAVPCVLVTTMVSAVPPLAVRLMAPATLLPDARLIPPTVEANAIAAVSVPCVLVIKMVSAVPRSVRKSMAPAALLSPVNTGGVGRGNET